jgi:streptomycin 6-kinase
MDELPLPAYLAEAVAAVDRGERERDARIDWIAQLPQTVRALAQQWSLRIGPPYEPGGQVSWVAPARDDAGRDVVLKVGWAHPEAAAEADALRLWAGDGAVVVYESYGFGATIGLLLEPCVPGTTLAATRPEEEQQDAVVAGLLRRLWRPAGDGQFPSLRAMCQDWADEFEQEQAVTPSYTVDKGLVRAGMAMFRSLPASADRGVLLCTDLHAENILAAQREPWLVIDPKPHVGDPAYDVLQHMLNCPGRLQRDPVGLCRRMAGLLDLDNDRVLNWMFARSVQESIGMPWLGEVAAALGSAVG